jgi:hypothetical protein
MVQQKLFVVWNRHCDRHHCAKLTEKVIPFLQISGVFWWILGLQQIVLFTLCSEQFRFCSSSSALHLHGWRQDEKMPARGTRLV